MRLGIGQLKKTRKMQGILLNPKQAQPITLLPTGQLKKWGKSRVHYSTFNKQNQSFLRELFNKVTLHESLILSSQSQPCTVPLIVSSSVKGYQLQIVVPNGMFLIRTFNNTSAKPEVKSLCQVGWVVSVSASHAIGCGFAYWLGHTKGYHLAGKRKGKSLTVQQDWYYKL